MPTTQLDPHFRPRLVNAPEEPAPAPRQAPVLRVLVFAGEPALSRVAAELRSRLGAAVVPVEDLGLGQAALQQADFDAIVVEETVVTETPSVLDDLQRWGGNAFVLEANLALASPARIVRQLRSALERQREEVLHARESAVRSLRSELLECVCGLLLASEIALSKAGPELRPALIDLVGLAEALSRQLHIEAP